MAKNFHIYVRYFAIIVLTVFIGIISGCSDKDRDKGDTPDPGTTAKVAFVFDLEQADLKGEVPLEVSGFQFEGYSDDECQTTAYGPKTEEKLTEGTPQTVTYDDVPVAVVKFTIKYLDQYEHPLYVSEVPVNLSEGAEETINVSKDYPPQSNTAEVTFNFDLDSIPAGVTTYEFTYFSDEACEEPVGLVKAVDKAETVKLDVPVEVVKVKISCKNADGKELATSETDKLTLEVGKAQSIPVVIKGDQSDLNLTIKNAFVPTGLTQANVTITYTSECIAEGTKSGNVTLDGSDWTGKIEKLEGLNIAVKSVTLIKPATDTTPESPFEWLDYETAQAVSGGALTLDVKDNEFVGGSGTNDAPFLIANPRQFRNIDSHLDSSFKQIADVDFAGSCGIAIDGEGNVSDTDANARYYNSQKGYTPLAADETAFTGTYDGGTYSIKNMVASSETSNTALFAKGEDCTFKNVTIDDTCSIKASGVNNTASLVGFLESGAGGSCSLDACISSAKIVVDGSSVYYVGGLVANCGGSDMCAVSLNKCVFGGSIKADGAYYVGLVGFAMIDTSNVGVAFQGCANTGNMTGYKYVGGILGYLRESGSPDRPVKFVACSNSGSLEACVVGCGGIVGFSVSDDVSFSNCANVANLTAKQTIGGILGVSGVSTEIYDEKLIMEACTCSGELIAETDSDSAYMGGLVGVLYVNTLDMTANIVECEFSFNDGARYVGGGVGRAGLGEGLPTEEELKSILSQGVSVSSACSDSIKDKQENLRGYYCGSPYITKT